MITRRIVLGSALSAPFVISARAADTLVVTAYGGEYQDVFVPTVVEPFEKKFGVKVTYDLSGGAAGDHWIGAMIGRSPSAVVRCMRRLAAGSKASRLCMAQRLSQQTRSPTRQVWVQV